MKFQVLFSGKHLYFMHICREYKCKIEFDISGKLSPTPEETVCMEFQILVSGQKIRKHFKMSSAKTFETFPSMLSIKIK